MTPASRYLRQLVLVACLLLGACKVELFANLSEDAANEMLAILMEQGIGAEKLPGKEGSFILNVDQDAFAEAVKLLKHNGYPRERFQSIGEIFKKQGLISSPLEERIRFVYALGQSLSETISQIDGVLGARVHVVLPNNELAVDNLMPSSAAAFIRHRADAPLDRLVPQIKLLVTNSIEGLSYDKVSVVLFPVDPALVARASEPMVKIAGIQLHPSTVSRFWMIMGGLGAVALLLLIGLGVMAWMWRRATTAPAIGVSSPPQIVDAR